MSLLRTTFLLPLLTTVLVPIVLGGKITIKLKESKNPIKKLYLDFDHTITVDGFSKMVVEIFCRHEKPCNCSRLPEGRCNGTDERSVNEMVTSLGTLPEGGLVNVTASLGGVERVNLLRSWVGRVRKTLNGNVYIVSTSWYPVSALQWQVYLKKVSDLLDLGFDLDHIKALADPGPDLSADKGAVIKTNMDKDNVPFASALFADDSGGNIDSARNVCNTLFLYRKKGMDQTDLDYIETLVNGCCDWSASSANQMGQGIVPLFLTVVIVNVIVMLQ